MSISHRLIQTVLGAPPGALAAPDRALSSSARGQVAISAIKAMQVGHSTYLKIETDAGLVGYGPCGSATGLHARGVIDHLHHGRLPHLGLIGKDPLAIQVHFHNMFHAYHQRGRQMQVLSGIDMALWDLAGKMLNLPVSRLLGGPFRDEIPLYSHCTGGDYFDRGEWRDRAQELVGDHRGFRAFKVDIHHSLGMPMQQSISSIGPQDARKVSQAYALAREAFGDRIDIIVHCHAELDLPTAIKVAQAVEPIDPLFYEDAMAPVFSEAWVALRRSTRLPLMTGENIALSEGALPFLQREVVDCLQPDLLNAGGITGTKMIADLAALYRIPICLHNVSGYGLDMASQQFSAAVFNCPMMECRRTADEAPEAASNAPVIRDGRVIVSQRPGMGYDFDQDYMKAHRAEGEPWWG